MPILIAPPIHVNEKSNKSKFFQFNLPILYIDKLHLEVHNTSFNSRLHATARVTSTPLKTDAHQQHVKSAGIIINAKCNNL